MSGSLIQDALSGRVALITGGATGIGYSIASHYAELGATVMLASRKQDHLDKAVAAIRASGGQAHALMLDVRDYDAVAAVVEQTLSICGGLDILINNAAGNFICPTAELSANAWKTVIDIDLNGTFYTSKAAYPALCASRFGGCIINITMTKTTRGWPGCAHASAAKAGILALTRTLAVEWGPDHIRVNAIAPGLIADTEGAKRLVEDQGKLEQYLATVPLGQLGAGRDIAELAVFLASPAARHISGTELTGRWCTAVELRSSGMTLRLGRAHRADIAAGNNHIIDIKMLIVG